MKAGAVGVVVVRVGVGEVREGRGGERGPLVVVFGVPLLLPLPAAPLGPVPVPAGGRRFAGEGISLRGMCGVVERLSVRSGSSCSVNGRVGQLSRRAVS